MRRVSCVLDGCLPFEMGEKVRKRITGVVLGIWLFVPNPWAVERALVLAPDPGSISAEQR